MRIYHSHAQKGENSCSTPLNKCSHLCLAISNNQHVCKCSIGYKIDPNNSNQCIGENEFLFYSIGHELRGVHFNSSIQDATNVSEVLSDNPNMNDEQIEHVLVPISRISLVSDLFIVKQRRKV